MDRRIMEWVLLLVFSAFGATIVTIGPNREFHLNGKPFFPIMQWLQNDNLISSEVQYGINLFAVPGNGVSAAKWCDAASAQGVYACCDWKASDVKSVVDKPGFFGWFFGDEPDLQSNAVPPDSIRRHYEGIKALDSNHVAFLTVTGGFYSKGSIPGWMKGSDSYYYDYPKYTDVIGFDRYPVYGYCRPDMICEVGEAQAELAGKYAKGLKATFQWIECSWTSSRWCDIPARGDYDGPYDYEIENEVWLAIINGANAIGYFTHSWDCPDYQQFCVSEEQKVMLKRVNGRITALTEVLGSPDAADQIKTSIAGVGGGKGNVEVKAKIRGDSLYLIAACPISMTGAADSQRVSLTVPGLSSPVAVLFENRSLTPAGNVFSDGFGKKSSVHIYAMKRGTASTMQVPAGLSSSAAIRLHNASFTIEIPAGIRPAELTIVDIAGREIAHGPLRFSGSRGETFLCAPPRALTAGIYFVTVHSVSREGAAITTVAKHIVCK